MKIVQSIGALQSAARKDYADRQTVLRDVLLGYMALPEDLRARAYPAVRGGLVQGGVINPEDAPEQYDPAFFEAAIGYGRQAEKAGAPIQVDPTKELRDPTGQRVIAPARPEPAKPPTPVSLQSRPVLSGGRPIMAAFNPQTGKYQDQTGKVLTDVRPIPTAAQQAGGGGEQAPELPPDPASADILSQTGLSMNGFMALTGRLTQLPRDAATRNRATTEAQAFARKRGVDVSTLASQYKAQNAVLESNISRLNNTKIMEQELAGTVENLQAVIGTDLSKVRIANVWKVWAGEQVNDPQAQQYAFHLGQLRNELAAYYAAAAGRPAWAQAGRVLDIPVVGFTLGIHVPSMAAMKEILPTLPGYAAAKTTRFASQRVITQTIVSGSGDIGAGDPIITLRAAEAGADVKIIGLVFNSTSLVFVVNGNKVKQLQDLQKPEIVVAVNSKGDFTNVLLVGPLLRRGVDLGKVTVVEIGGSGARTKALLAGRVDLMDQSLH